MFKKFREKYASWKKKIVEDSKPDLNHHQDNKKLPEKTTVEQPSTTVDQDIYSDSFFAHRINLDKFNELLWELELMLLESDVALSVIEEIKEEIKNNISGKKIKRDISINDAIEQILREAIMKALTVDAKNFDYFIKNTEKPIVILFVGINGTGKTTTIAKVANRLMKKGYTCVIAAGDTFRAGAIEQLERHAEKLGIRLVKHKPNSDSAAVAFDAIEHAKARHRDVVLIDTAGRMQTNQNLMDEMKKIKKVSKPHMVVFVGDALAGNDAIEQASTFEKGIGIDAVILNKIDADVKGGAALSIAHTVKKPILFVGTGQGYDDLIEFSPEWMTQRLFTDA